MKDRKQYTAEFKKEAVQLSYQPGRTVKQQTAWESTVIC